MKRAAISSSATPACRPRLATHRRTGRAQIRCHEEAVVAATQPIEKFAIRRDRRAKLVLHVVSPA
jgi:hypothetical protein